MPFRSRKQARFMFAKHPGIARRWVNESGRKHPIRGLPETAKRRARGKR